MLKLKLIAAAAAILATAGAAHATQITDPANDFYVGYTGPQNGDLDVLTTSADIVGTNLILGAKVNGTVGTTPNWQFVWGINRGNGTARFGATLAGVLFDAVVSITATTKAVNLLDPAPTVSQTLPTANVVTSLDTITVTVPLALLPTRGFAAPDYGINLWPRVSNIAGVAGIADFAPDNATFKVPEPASLALLGFAVAGLALTRRRAG